MAANVCTSTHGQRRTHSKAQLTRAGHDADDDKGVGASKNHNPTINRQSRHAPNCSNHQIQHSPRQQPPREGETSRYARRNRGCMIQRAAVKTPENSKNKMSHPTASTGRQQRAGHGRVGSMPGGTTPPTRLYHNNILEHKISQPRNCTSETPTPWGIVLANAPIPTFDSQYCRLPQETCDDSRIR